MKHLPRTADIVLKERLEAFGAVLIEGPKWTGKTTTAQQQAQSGLKLQDPDRREEKLTTAETMPSLLLNGTEYEYLLHEDNDLFDKEHKTE